LISPLIISNSLLLLDNVVEKGGNGAGNLDPYKDSNNPDRAGAEKLSGLAERKTGGPVGQVISTQEQGRQPG
jgi:hypothetical protein